MGGGGEVQVCCSVFDSSSMMESSWELACPHCSGVRISIWNVVVSLSINRE